jgi:hypothetical protein
MCSSVEQMCASSTLVSIVCTSPECDVDPPCSGLSAEDTSACLHPPTCCQ